MSELIGRKDWSETPLGSPDTWPVELQTTLDVVLASRFPMIFWWGPELLQFYNDAYLPVMGEKHPKALGQTARECWLEIWDAIGPQLTSIQHGGPATWNEDVLLDINRHGYVGESYFTWSYSPIPKDTAPNGVGGILCIVQEQTEKVIGERRILLLRDLAAYSAEAKSAEEECRLAATTIGRYARSVPFALIYLIDESRKEARLVATAGIDPADEHACPQVVDLTAPGPSAWPLYEAFRSETLVKIDDLSYVLECVPPGPWPEAPREGIVVPVQSGIAHEPAGFLVAGINPRERFDDRYRSLYELMAGQIASAIAASRAYENERKRAEALIELDRAKIEFFSNVSHEFRTPLTLMLGPLQQLLRDADPNDAQLLETAHRNALRLLKLVNTLLEFARLEAGRSDATFVETDVAVMTQDLCSLFRSAIESAGLTFSVEIDVCEPAYVDRAMWEMIVLNLLSNALKFTHSGEIVLRLVTEPGAGHLALSVRDTGIGIPASDMPHVFERFRRVRGAKSRSHEGSGIGLALVDELVRLHGGIVEVRSEVGAGSTFTVTIPLGRDHLDPAKVVAVGRTSSHQSVVSQYLADVDSTIVQGGNTITPPSEAASKSARVLVADDNADLRGYVGRILAPHHDVVTVRNGVEALHALRDNGPFDLLITDVMMPEMDGFELVEHLRGNPALAATPVIMLSARAGESSAIEGLSRGADDYLVKPFSSEELLARVFAQLNAKAIRDRSIEALRLNEERFRSLAASMPHIVLEAHPDDGITFLSQAYAEYCGVPVEAGYGSGWRDVVHRDDYPALMESWENALRDASDFESEFRLRRKDGAYRWYVGRAVAQRDDRGRPVRYTGTVTDIHDMRRSVQERAFLSEASRIMSQTLDLELTLRGLADSTVPQFADWCQIHLTEPDGIRVLAISHVDSEKHALAQRLVGRLHFNRDALEGTPLVLRTGRPTIMDEPDRTAAEVVNDEPELKIYRRLGLGSAVVVPLVAEGRTLGTISLVYAQSGRRYSEDDVPVLEELGRRAGVAVRRANEFQREHRVAQSFQEASLPAELPAIAGATFDAVYVPADNDVQVGGDWYDAMRLVDGRIVLSIGDVAGNGLRAAVTMGNIRQIIRGIAQVHADPALMLDAADRALRLEHPDQYVTAFVGVYDPIAETFAYASAGHPPAILRRPDGTIQLLSDGGLPLGLRQISKENGKTVRVGAGSYLVLYTDGLTEATRRPADGEARLLSMLVDDEGHALLASPHPAEALRQALLGGTPAKDDVAIMVVGIHPGAEPGLKTTDGGETSPHVQRWFFATDDAEAAQAARREFGDGLRLRHADEEMLYKAQVVFGELVGNAARYAPGTIEVTVDWTGPLPVLHIFDNGPGFHHIPALPRDVYSESGRGLFIISLMSEDFSVSRRPDGGSHARAVLALRGTPSRSIA